MIRLYNWIMGIIYCRFPDQTRYCHSAGVQVFLPESPPSWYVLCFCLLGTFFGLNQIYTRLLFSPLRSFVVTFSGMV